MTRLSQLLLPTERQPPADAEALSHKLLVRAGLVRQVGAGLWSWLPAGHRVQQRVIGVIREELDGIGAQEMLMPVLNPAELWRRSGRGEIDELFKLKDRKGADMVLALSHEEVVTSHVAAAVRSYRDLPLILYHFQTKERDEPRPRAGVLRTREFVMKDSYTFDRDLDGLEVAYAKHIGAYDRIFDRCGLEWYRVRGDVGMMGGLGADEYMAPCPAGENDVALAAGYAANLEIASADPVPVALAAAPDTPVRVSTPGLSTVAAVARELSLPEGALLKAYPVMVEGTGLQLVLLRGDHRVAQIKLQNTLGVPFRPAQPQEITAELGPPGFLGPVGVRVPVLLDGAVLRTMSASGGGGFVTGAGESDVHLRGVVPGRDFSFQEVDVREVMAGDTVAGAAVRVEPAIEIGNIFKLGTRYSEPLGASYLDESGRAQPVVMGSYGIGPARVAAAAVEQFADEQGISWPRSISPFDVHVVPLGKAASPELDAAEELYRELGEAGLQALLDDRDAGPGEKFADAELLGCPLRVTVGRRGLAAGELEVQLRRGRESRAVPLEGAAATILELWRATA